MLQQQSGGLTHVEAPPVVAGAVTAVSMTVGLGCATSNGPHEKNEDAALVARFSRISATAGTPLSITSALAGCGLKSDDPASGSRRRRGTDSDGDGAAGPGVSVVGIEDGGGLDGSVVAHLAAVLDGHGGRGTAKWASRRLPHLVAEHLARAAPAASLTTPLVNALRGFDRWWSDAMHDPEISRHGHDDSGSTAAVALAAPAVGAGAGWRLAVCNLGDSRALLVDASDGSVRELSVAHNTGNTDELERLMAAGAQVVHPQPGAVSLADGHARFFPKGPIWGKRGLKVSRALGDVHFKRPHALVIVEPHCVEVVVPPGGGPHLLLLLTDGVTDVLAAADIAAAALGALGRPAADRMPGLPAHDDDARAAAHAIVAAAAASGRAFDNMSCTAVVLSA